ncbi:hypothetical protein BJ138DRAFT_1160083 [Hygrophoropsis aurantiaca]|uniref:Uncharacterized protein n=1 Tax=Hygrophoropsis aurantiaca TaxID=72124 RepID=A0ACB8A2Q0_9AGAM|nr:hypothetical protein BJ138DRAFT_1160083 [Hygrophoropsis aurantiaca]
MANPPRSFLIPANLGDIKDYDLNEMMIDQYNGSSFKKGEMYLRLSMKQLNELREISRKAQVDLRQEQRDLRLRWDRLEIQRTKLSEARDTGQINLWKQMSTAYACRQFRKSTHNLVRLIAQTSDTIRRGVLSVESIHLSRLTPGNMPRGRVAGIAVSEEELDRVFEDTTNTTNSSNPFVDPSEGSTAARVSSDRSTGGSTPISNSDMESSTNQNGSIVNNYYNNSYNNSLIALDSTITNPTINSAGGNNQGAVTHAVVINATQSVAAVAVSPNAAS